MKRSLAEIELLDLEPKTVNFLKEILMGLSKSQKTIHPKYLYDKKGSEIFEMICNLPEYYPTSAERSILQLHGKEIARLIGRDALIIEPGAGSCEKTRILLHFLNKPSGYVPIEISREILLRMTMELSDEFTDLRLFPVCADFTQDIDLPLTVESQRGNKVIFFPGSTIGNLHPFEATIFLKKLSKLVGTNGELLIGVDLKKDPSILESAYNDSSGVTASFNLNLLTRLNREADANFQLNNFQHEAIYNQKLGRVEMHLRSKIPQLVRVNQTIFRFREGETIHTECSYKYTVEEFCEFAAKARFVIKKFWLDEKNQFAVYYFSRE